MRSSPGYDVLGEEREEPNWEEAESTKARARGEAKEQKVVMAQEEDLKESNEEVPELCRVEEVATKRHHGPGLPLLPPSHKTVGLCELVLHDILWLHVGRSRSPVIRRQGGS